MLGLKLTIEQNVFLLILLIQGFPTRVPFAQVVVLFKATIKRGVATAGQ
jgi:hypothetical protein